MVLPRVVHRSIVATPTHHAGHGPFSLPGHRHAPIGTIRASRADGVLSHSIIAARGLAGNGDGPQAETGLLPVGHGFTLKESRSPR